LQHPYPARALPNHHPACPARPHHLRTSSPAEALAQVETLTLPPYNPIIPFVLSLKEIPTMRTVKLIVPALAASLLLSACVNTAHVEKDKTVNLGAYHTYAWVNTKSEKDSLK